MPSGGTTPKVMSLKAFHLVFVIASILMGIFVGAWGIREYQVSGDIAALVLGVVFIALGVFLIVYGRKMLKKTESIKEIERRGQVIFTGTVGPSIS